MEGNPVRLEDVKDGMDLIVNVIVQDYSTNEDGSGEWKTRKRNAEFVMKDVQGVVKNDYGFTCFSKNKGCMIGTIDVLDKYAEKVRELYAERMQGITQAD